MKLIYCLLTIAILFSCGKDEEVEKKPVAIFEINNHDEFAPTEVSFTNLSTDAEDYVWDFGDGSTSLEFEPSHYYTSPGEYIVELLVFGQGGKDSQLDRFTLNSSGDAIYTIENRTNFVLENVRSFYLDWETSIVYEIIDHGNLNPKTSTDETRTTIPTVEVLFEFDQMFYHLAFATQTVVGEIVNVLITDTTNFYILESNPIVDDKSTKKSTKKLQIKDFSTPVARLRN